MAGWLGGQVEGWVGGRVGRWDGVIWSSEAETAVETVPGGPLGVEFSGLGAKPENCTLEAVWRRTET